MPKHWLIILLIFPGALLAHDIPTDFLCPTPSVSIAGNNNNICAGTSITIHATVVNAGTNEVYNWKVNNLFVAVSSIPDFSSANYHNGDMVICEYTSHTSCGLDTTVVSNSFTIHVLNDVTPLITVSNDDPLICEGEVTTFIATAFYGNEQPLYQWTVNDIPVGTNSPMFTTNTITNGAKVECMLTVSSPSCPGTSQSVTSQLTIYVYPLIHPAIDITPSKTDICKGETVIFTAIANGGTSASLEWEVNGAPIGVVARSFTTNTLQDGDVISCTVTVPQDSRCNTTTSAGSNQVVIHVRDFPEPSLNIDAPLLEACAGNPLTFTATPQNAGINKFYQWQVNGKNVSSGNPSFIYNKFADGDKVSCNLSTDIPGCPLYANVGSNVKTVTILQPPQITFSPPDITIFAGEKAQLNASVAGNLASYMWQPSAALTKAQSLMPFTIPLLHDTSFNLSVVDTKGCSAAGDIYVKVLHKLYMPSAFTPNNDGLNDIFRIPSGTSLTLHSFSVFDRWGNSVFTTSDINRGWDGKVIGEIAGNGIYVYTITGLFNDKQVVIKGMVALLR